MVIGSLENPIIHDTPCVTSIVLQLLISITSLKLDCFSFVPMTSIFPANDSHHSQIWVCPCRCPGTSQKISYYFLSNDRIQKAASQMFKLSVTFTGIDLSLSVSIFGQKTLQVLYSNRAGKI